MKFNFLNELNSDLPVFEKWGRGRPTKEMIERRKKWQEAFMERSKKEGGFLSSLTNKDNLKEPSIENGKVKIKYYPK